MADLGYRPLGEHTAAAVGTQAPPRTSWTAPALLAATFPEPRWAVRGLIPEGLTLFGGAPKLGKSWFALGVGIAISSGGKALGKVDVDQGEALYLALEDPPRRLQKRLQLMLRDEPAPAGLHFETEWKRVTDGGGDDLDKWLAAHPHCRLLVVDVLARVRAASTDNASRYDQDYAAMVVLKALADRHRLAVVVVHHTRKQGSEDFLDLISGTHGLAGAADTVVVLARARNAADAVLHVTGRDVEEAQLALRFDGAIGAWTLLEGPASDYELGDTRRRVLSLLRDSGAMRPKQVAETLGEDYELVKKTLRRMADADQLDTDGQGFYMPYPPVPRVPAVPARDTRDGRDARDTRDGRDTPPPSKEHAP